MNNFWAIYSFVVTIAIVFLILLNNALIKQNERLLQQSHDLVDRWNICLEWQKKLLEKLRRKNANRT